MRLTKFNTETNEYEYRERAKTQEEFNAQRKAVIQRLGELEDKASDVAEEIFELIDCAFSPVLVYNGYTVKEYLAELKKKYTESEKGNGK